MRPLAALLLAAWTTLGTAAADVREIGCADLIPAHAPLEHPLHGVERAIREDLARLARVRIHVKQGFLSPDSAEVAEAEALIATRKAEGTDLRALDAAVTAYQAELDRRQVSINTALDGQVIRMPGYALPLEFAGTGATELFLVPFVGACIHVPPPPPNQIVTMSLDTPLALKGLFEPVWVTGRVRVEQSSRSLSLVDGSADIPYGYRLTDVRVEPYN